MIRFSPTAGSGHVAKGPQRKVAPVLRADAEDEVAEGYRGLADGSVYFESPVPDTHLGAGRRKKTEDKDADGEEEEEEEEERRRKRGRRKRTFGSLCEFVCVFEEKGIKTT